MLTVKHIRLSGDEAVYQAYEVHFVPTPAEKRCKTRSPIECSHDGGSLILTKPCMGPGEAGSYEFAIDGGTIFIMNDHGKTVSRYDLGASMVPVKEEAPISTGYLNVSPSQLRGSVLGSAIGSGGVGSSI